MSDTPKCIRAVSSFGTAKRVAAPLWGGLISLTILTLAVTPAFYVIWRGFQLRRAPADSPPATEAPISGGAP